MLNMYRWFIVCVLINTAIFFSFYVSHVIVFGRISNRLAVVDEKPFEQLSPSSLLHLNQTIKRIAAIDRIFIINLPARTDRRTTAIALFQTLHLDIHIVPALHPQSS